VEIQTRPLSIVEAVTHLAGLALGDLKRLTHSYRSATSGLTRAARRAGT
jgi:hypothetical protein